MIFNITVDNPPPKGTKVEESEAYNSQHTPMPMTSMTAAYCGSRRNLQKYPSARLELVAKQQKEHIIPAWLGGALPLSPLASSPSSAASMSPMIVSPLTNSSNSSSMRGFQLPVAAASLPPDVAKIDKEHRAAFDIPDEYRSILSVTTRAIVDNIALLHNEVETPVIPDSDVKKRGMTEWAQLCKFRHYPPTLFGNTVCE